MKKLVTLLALVTILLAACGGDSEPKVWNESDIVESMDMSRSGSNWEFITSRGTCNVAVVLTTKSQVKMYKDAGDNVATNPDESAGVKIVSSEDATCYDAATELLKDLD